MLRDWYSKIYLKIQNGMNQLAMLGNLDKLAWDKVFKLGQSFTHTKKLIANIMMSFHNWEEKRHIYIT